MRAVMDYTHDLRAGTLLVSSKALFVCGEAEAHELRLTVTDGGSPANLAGVSFKAYCVLSNRATALATASRTGNVVSLLFPASFYTLPGETTILLRAINGGVKYDLMCYKCIMQPGVTNTIYDPGGELPDLYEMQTIAAACEAATEAAIAAAQSLGSIRAEAATLATGADATAVYSPETGVLMLGLPRGAAGEKGDKGDTGITPNIVIGNVTTGAPGSFASVSKGGTREEPRLHFVIPRGDVGPAYVVKGPAYSSLAALQAGVTTPAMGDQYNVGSAPPYNVYRWTGADWEDQGTIGLQIERITDAAIDALIAAGL